MEYVAHKYEQEEQEYLSLVMDLKTIYETSKALIYDKDKFGYQRPLDEKHSDKIKNKVLSNKGLFPTSIVLSIDKKAVEKLISQLIINNTQISDIVKLTLPDKVSLQNPLFRIVDGQHRIEGLAKAAKINTELWNYKLNVIILLIPKDQRVIELDVFNDINSTPKKLKTDLVLLARQQYILEKQKNISNRNEVEEYLSIRIAYVLNEKIENSVWNNAIKFEKEINSQIGIIGVSAFKKAIAPVVREFLNNHYNIFIGFKLSVLHDLAEVIANTLDKIWNIVENKWKSCFGNYSLILESKKHEFHYNNSYYLQKTTGVNAITQIFYEVMKEDNSLEKFEQIIEGSPLVEEDWIKGGRLSGLTSGSGFKKAVLLVKYGKDKMDNDNIKEKL